MRLASRHNALINGLLLLAALGVMVRALIPAGFMPEFGTGGTQIVICSGVTETTITVDDHGQPLPAGDHKDQPCAFMATAQLTGPEAAPLLLQAEIVAFLHRAPALHLIAPLPAADYPVRGPPVFSI